MNTLKDSLKSELAEISAKLESIHRHVNSYQYHLPEEFKETSYYDPEREFGHIALAENYSIPPYAATCLACSKSKFPHVFHSFNPQLNNISDMILSILQKIEKSHSIEDKVSPHIQRLENLLEEIKTDSSKQLEQETLAEILKELKQRPTGSGSFQTPANYLTRQELEEVLQKWFPKGTPSRFLTLPRSPY